MIGNERSDFTEISLNIEHMTMSDESDASNHDDDEPDQDDDDVLASFR